MTINGVQAHVGQVVEPEDELALDGQPVVAEPVETYLLNKPAGTVSSASDPEGRPTVLDALPADLRLYPVGRLDIDTTGALLITNDGELANALMHPRQGVGKTYEALVAGQVSSGSIRLLRQGVELEDGRTAPARVERIARRDAGGTWLEIEITEGRNRQVKRMGEAIGHPVRRLHRSRYAGVGLKGLSRGSWRPLGPHELAKLRRVAGIE